MRALVVSLSLTALVAALSAGCHTRPATPAALTAKNTVKKAAPAKKVVGEPTKPAAKKTAETAKPAAAATPASKITALEHQPGATPTLPGTIVPAGPKAAGLPGVPGPSPAIGPSNAPVKVFVFSDFECPVCRRVVEPIKALARAYPHEVQIIFKNNALPMHPRSASAAIAALAAMRQGKFWQYHDKLFQDQQALQESDLIRYAKEIGLNIPKFKRDMADAKLKAQVDYERALAAKLGLRGTPGFFINGQKQVGWGSYGGFKAMVDRALSEVKPFAKKGVPAAKIAIEATRAHGDDGKLFTNLVWGIK